MPEVLKKIEKFCSQSAEKLGLYFLEVSVKNLSSSKPIVTVVADSDSGITIDECAKLSREIADLIDAYELLPQMYRLDVTSPGMSRPMEHEWQLKRALGKRVKIVLREDKDTGKSKEYRGDFKAYDAEKYTLDLGKKKGEITINRGDVSRIYVVPQW
jgi:ribosome maturation factor RimP